MGKIFFNLGMDLDNTITAYPEFFATLSKIVKNSGGKVYVVTSRFYKPELKIEAIDEVKSLFVKNVWSLY